MCVSIFNIYILLLFFIFGINVEALTSEELQQKYAEMIIDCFKDHPISMEDLELLKGKKMSDNESVKCLFACAYRRAGMMDDKGELSVDGVNEMTKIYFSDDPDKVKKSEEFTNACKTVNEISVSDGAKGCERAALIFQCTVEKAPQFDFV